MVQSKEQELARLRWHCRRGMLELDLLLQGFLDKRYRELERVEQERFTRLLALPDQVLLEYLLKQEPIREKEFVDVVDKIRAAATD